MTEPFLPPGLEPPEPPEALRGRALCAARAALARPSAPDRWTRLLASPAARLAWAASVLLLLAAHALLPRRGAPTASALRAASPDPEVTAIARLPRIDERTLSRAGAPL